MNELLRFNRNVRAKIRNAMKVKGIDTDTPASRLRWPISEICHYVEDSNDEIETGRMIDRMFLMDCKQADFFATALKDLYRRACPKQYAGGAQNETEN